MFYVEASLKKGGKFYLCWLAFTWPPLFEKVTNRQISLVNIEQTCDQLMFVFNKESGNPRSRFSLRLSSQLVFGIIKIYERQVKLLCLDLLQFESLVWKPKKSKSRSKNRPKTIKAIKLPDPDKLVLIPQDHLEERLQQSGNAVANIEDITLKDAVIPEHQPPADGFGEENPDQVLQMLQDQTMEMMLGAGAGEASMAAVSGDANLLDVDRSKDVSTLQLTRTRMEGIPELETPVFRKTIGGDELESLRKDSPTIPSPTTKQPAMIIQEPELQQKICNDPPMEPTTQIPTVHEQKGMSDAHITRGSRSSQLTDLVLEPFIEEHGKTKKKKKLIIDQKIKIDTAVFKHQISMNNEEVKVQDILDVNMVTPAQTLLVRPAHAGHKLSSSRVPRELLGMFHRRATLVPTNNAKDKELLRLASGKTIQSKNVTGNFAGSLLRRGSQRTIFVKNHRTRVNEENNNMLVEENAAVNNIPEELNNKITEEEYSIEQINDSRNMLEDSRKTNIPNEMDKLDLNNEMTVEKEFHLLPTQILRPKRRLFEENNAPSRKRSKVSQSTPKKVTCADRNTPATELLYRLDISKISDVVEGQEQVNDMEKLRPDKSSQYSVVAPELENLQQDVIVQQHETENKKQSDSDETQLGSLDRTQVSLGDSNKSTNSVIKRIRENWNGPATCGYIVKAIKECQGPLTVNKLISLHRTEGPQRIIAALCFSSILRLHSKGYVRVIKKPGTNEIHDIIPGEQLQRLLI